MTLLSWCDELGNVTHGLKFYFDAPYWELLLIPIFCLPFGVHHVAS
jgi:hypothetical protein